MKQYIAGRALIFCKDKILIIRESASHKGNTNVGKYDLPGGKISPGEKYQDGLKREVKEECGIDIEIGDHFFIGEWYPVINNKKIQIIGVFSKCLTSSDKIELGTSHDDYQWIPVAEYRNFPLIDPISEAMESYLKNK